MAAQKKTKLIADESVIAYFNFTKPPTAEGITGIIKKSALLLSYVSECLDVSTAHGFVAHTDSDDEHVSNKLGRVKLDRESIAAVLEKQSAVLDSLFMHIPSRNTENIVTDNVATLGAEAGDDTRGYPKTSFSNISEHPR